MKEIFESAIEKILADHVTQELVLRAEDQGWIESLWELLEESGFALAAVPEQQGGADASWNDLGGVVQLCGRYALPLPLPEAMFANWLLGSSGIEGQAGPLSFAASNDLHWHGQRLSGSVFDVPWGRFVDKMVAVVDSDSPSVVVLQRESAAGSSLNTNLAGEARDGFTFDDCDPILSAPLPPELGPMVLLGGGAMLRSAQIAGALEALLIVAGDYANERVQFGKPIGKFQAVQHQLAVLAEHVAAARVAAQAAFAESGGSLATLSVMAAKICASEAASVGASTGHGVHGAIGFTREYSLHPLTRRLWAWRSEYGSATYWSKLLGRSVCEAGSGAFWPTITSGELKK